MTMTWPHGSERELTPPLGNVPPDSTVALLQDILAAVKESGERQQVPSDGVFILSPDATQGPNNGRLFYGAHKTRLTRLVLIASGAVTFTVQVGSSAILTLPATVAGAFSVVDMPFPYVMDRGTTLQILATAATWAGYAIGSTE